MKARTTLCMTFAAVGLIVVPCFGQFGGPRPVEHRRLELIWNRPQLNVKGVLIDADAGGWFVGEHQPSANLVNATADRYRQRLKRFMDVRVDEVKRVCQPSTGQQKKIEVAAKGAVEQMMQKWRDTTAQVPAPPPVPLNGRVRAVGGQRFVGKFDIDDNFILPAAPVQKLPAFELEAPVRGPAGAVVVPKVAAAPPVAAAVPQAPADVPAFAAANVRLAVPALQQPADAALDVSSVEGELVWRKTLRRVLTDEQKATYRRAALERRDWNGDSAGDCVIELLDHQLLLAGSQRERLAAVIEQRLGARRLEMLVAVNPHAERAEDGANQRANARVITYVTQRIASSLVEGVLTAPQLAWWTELRSGSAPIAVPEKRTVREWLIEQEAQ